MKKILNVSNIALIAVLGALGAVLMVIDFPIFVAPSFYKLDLGDLPCVIGALALGPIPALFIQIVKIIIKLLIKPTSTAFVGEIAAFVFSSMYCVIAASLYSIKKTKKNAYVAILISSLISVIITCIGNYYFIIPSYVKLFNMPLAAIIGAGNAIFPMVKDKLSFVLYCVAPFNLIKFVLVGILTILLYKRVSNIIKNIQK